MEQWQPPKRSGRETLATAVAPTVGGPIVARVNRQELAELPGQRGGH